MANISDLRQWIKNDVSRFSPIDTHIQDLSTSEDGGQIWRFAIYTQNHKYSIVAKERGDGGYLGCISTNRMPNVGEDWLRGSDLADGKLEENTWHKILADIVSYEMVSVPR